MISNLRVGPVAMKHVLKDGKESENGVIRIMDCNVLSRFAFHVKNSRLKWVVLHLPLFP